jgi:hypothetical protein
VIHQVVQSISRKVVLVFGIHLATIPTPISSSALGQSVQVFRSTSAPCCVVSRSNKGCCEFP